MYKIYRKNIFLFRGGIKSYLFLYIINLTVVIAVCT